VEVGLVGDTLYVRFDGRMVFVHNPEHVAAFRALLQHPEVAALVSPVTIQYEEETDDEDIN
jgi:hypothetical protein